MAVPKRNEDTPSKGPGLRSKVREGRGWMKKLVTLMVVLAFTLVIASGVALAQPKADEADVSSTAVPAPSKVDVSGIPTEGLTAPTGIKGSGREPLATAAGDARWLDGTSSNTYYYNPIFNQVQWLTTEWVGYWGKEDASYPRVGELYYGHVVIGNVNPSQHTPVMAEISLPEETNFYIDPSNTNTRVRCLLENINTGTSAELTGDNCPQQPTQGTHGAQFAPKAGFWDLKPGEMVSVVFPVYSTTELRGIAATPADCMVGSVWAAASLDIWDEPQVGDSCPLPKDHGVYQGVFVSPNPATISYPTPSATNITQTSARTTGYLYSHFAGGKAYVDLGTSTTYGQVSSLDIPDTSDAFTINTDWPNLKPGTTYHWRLRFVDDQNHVYKGLDQAFTTRADTTAPRVNRVVPAENATGIAPAANVSAVFSENMRSSTVSASTVKLTKKDSTSSLAATVTYDATAKKATLNPDASLQRGATYKATVTTGAKDLAGNALDQSSTTTGNQPKSWTFTVAN
jgi:hypothetical protein